MTLTQALNNIDESDNEIISLMSGMISIPAISPESGGEGEAKRADYLAPFLFGFDEVKRFDYEDSRYPGKIRSSLAAIKKGKKPGTIWILSHIDTVPIGDRSEWKYDPFKLTVKKGLLYGRGTEDDGEAVVASILASQQFIRKKFEGHSFGLLLCADEEIGSNYGLLKFIDSDIFTKDDMFLIPDSSAPGNASIHVMEKSIVWVKVKIKGKAAHGSCPRQGLNPIPVGMELIKEIYNLQKKYNQTNESFEDPRSTFTPTRLEVSPGGVNAIPSYMYFAIDCRFIPDVNFKDVIKDVEKIIEKHQATTDCEIEHSYLEADSGKASSTDTKMYKVLAEAIESVINKPVKPAGPNGGTCAGILRAKGYNCYCWLMHTGSEHMPNEHTSIENVKADAKVMATLIYKMCV